MRWRAALLCLAVIALAAAGNGAPTGSLRAGNDQVRLRKEIHSHVDRILPQMMKLAALQLGERSGDDDENNDPPADDVKPPVEAEKKDEAKAEKETPAAAPALTPEQTQAIAQLREAVVGLNGLMGKIGMPVVADKLDIPTQLSSLHSLICSSTNSTNPLCKEEGNFQLSCGIQAPQCVNGGSLDSELCRCKCNEHWSGRFCSECDLRCRNGGFLNSDSCTCDCASPWTGEGCEECPLKCNNGGVLDPHNCVCKCSDLNPFIGMECDVCNAAVQDYWCQHEGVFNVDKCACECKVPWGGPRCEFCQRDCENGGTLDAETCSCKCRSPWDGETCEACTRDRQSGHFEEKNECSEHGMLDANTCSCLCEDHYSDGQCSTFHPLACEPCMNGGKYSSSESCECTCSPPWQGSNCEKCGRECRNGGILNSAECECLCKGQFTGPECDACDLKCENGGEKDASTCTCKCPYPWEGLVCKDCNLLCEHGGSRKQDGSCACDCDAPWQGEACETCGRKPEDCKHGGKLHKESCKCRDCAFPWGGDLCEDCTLTPEDCKHGGKLDPATCTCTDCTAPWQSGEKNLCEVCTLKKEDCKHGGRVDEKQCRCVNCEAPWQGPKCEKCGLSEDMCQNGATLSLENCSCSLNCPPEFGGNVCGKCLRDPKECRHSSKLNVDTCLCEGCSDEWNGDSNCNRCVRKEEDCPNGSRFSEEECRCVDCPWPWSGDLCNRCNLADAHCSHNGVVNKDTCSCEKCHGPYSGVLCGKCLRSEDDCQHGTFVPWACRCDCPFPWGGDLCNECQRAEADCVRGKLDPKTCKCTDCPPGFTGELCEVCEFAMDKNFKCHNNGILNPQTCRCEGCAAPWVGDMCSTCGRTQEECAHGKLDHRTCECSVGCTAPWSGPLCGACNRKQIDCQHGSELDLDLCICHKKLDPKLSEMDRKAQAAIVGCPFPWEGELCEVCGLTADYCKGGTFDKNNCKCTTCGGNWAGDACSTCPLQCSHGSTLDPQGCVCAGCPVMDDQMPDKAVWGGTECKTCQLEPSDCKRGSTLNTQQCECQSCPAEYRGNRFCDSCPVFNNQQCGGTSRGRCIRPSDGSEPFCMCNTGFDGRSCNLETKDVSCSSIGDPHARTFDDRYFDWYGRGEYVLYKNPHPNREEVHVIQAHIKTAMGHITANSAFSVKFWNRMADRMDTVIVGFPQSGREGFFVKKNCEDIQLPINKGFEEHGFMLKAVGTAPLESFIFELPNRRLRIETGTWVFDVGGTTRKYMNIHLSTRAAADGSLQGLCGNFDNDPYNDIYSSQNPFRPDPTYPSIFSGTPWGHNILNQPLMWGQKWGIQQSNTHFCQLDVQEYTRAKGMNKDAIPFGSVDNNHQVGLNEAPSHTLEHIGDMEFDEVMDANATAAGNATEAAAPAVDAAAADAAGNGTSNAAAGNATAAAGNGTSNAGDVEATADQTPAGNTGIKATKGKWKRVDGKKDFGGAEQSRCLEFQVKECCSVYDNTTRPVNTRGVSEIVYIKDVLAELDDGKRLDELHMACATDSCLMSHELVCNDNFVSAMKDAMIKDFHQAINNARQELIDRKVLLKEQRHNALSGNQPDYH